jgi:sugar/nucleoside kinase (ribokinase family)
MTKAKIKITGTGCALADFLYASVDFEAPGFRKYRSQQTGDGGLSPGKLVFTSELESFAQKPYPEVLNEIVQEKEFDSVNIGGPSLVSLIHVAQMLPADCFEVDFYGCTGSDQTAAIIREKLVYTPLNCDNYIALSTPNTAFTHVLSDPNYDGGHGERTFINNIGASSDYLPEMLPDSFFEADLVCFGGTALVPRLHDDLTELLKKAKAKQAITLVNTVFDFRNEKSHPGEKWPLGNSAESFPLIDILIMDCEEAQKISGMDNIREAALYFETCGIPSFIITNGSQNLLAYSNGTIFGPMPITEFPVSAEVGQQLRENRGSKGDTTGCGDNFVGGIIVSIANQLTYGKKGSFSLTEAVSWGVASGGFTCFYLGGTYFEKHSGEKRAIIKSLQQKYLHQIGK